MGYNQVKSCFKKIAGLNIKLNYYEGRASTVLVDELSYYPDVTDTEEPDIQFCFFKPSKFEVVANNPSTYFHCTNGFGVNLGGYTVFWLFQNNNDIPTVYFHLNTSEKFLYYKLKGMQFTHPFEEIGQIFHEGVLQPSILLFFNNDIALIHGSALVSENGESYIFGGTGGVGKTSLELELIFSKNYNFLADDITFVGKSGRLYANFNFPKIYGYNLKNSPMVKNRLLSNRALSDRFWWKIQYYLKKPDKYRRRANIQKFYNGKISDACSVNNYVILSRTNISRPKLREITPDKAALLNAAVIYTEFSRIFNLSKFSHFNSILLDQDTTINLEDVIHNTTQTLGTALKRANCIVLDMPESFRAQDVKRIIPGLLDL